jgi:hypothetical protein
MNPADVKTAKLVPTEGQPPDSHDDLEEQLRATLKDLRRTNHQSKPAEDLRGSNDKLDDQLRVSVEALLHPSPPSIPADEVDDLLLAITHHLDNEASERKKIYGRLLAIQNEMGGLASRGFTHLVALCIGLAVVLGWLSYGDGAKQRIASWVQQLGWTKPPAVAAVCPQFEGRHCPQFRGHTVPSLRDGILFFAQVVFWAFLLMEFLAVPSLVVACWRFVVIPFLSQSPMRRLSSAVDAKMAGADHDNEAVELQFTKPARDVVFV